MLWLRKESAVKDALVHTPRQAHQTAVSGAETLTTDSFSSTAVPKSRLVGVAELPSTTRRRCARAPFMSRVVSRDGRKLC